MDKSTLLFHGFLLLGVLTREINGQWTWESLQKFDFASNKPHFDTGFKKLYICRVNQTSYGGDVLAANVGFYEHPASSPDRKKCYSLGRPDLGEFGAESDLSKIDILNFSDKLKWVWIEGKDLNKYLPKMVPAGIFKFKNEERYVCRMPTRLKCGKVRKLEATDYIGRVYPSEKQYGEHCKGIPDDTTVLGVNEYEVLVAED